MWNQQIPLNTIGTVEFGMHQIDTKLGVPKWRRHGRGRRFESVSNALFSNKGARAACLGKSSYPKLAFAAGSQLFVPYVATWLKGSEHAYLVRPSAAHPEVTLVFAAEIEVLASHSHQSLFNALAQLFAQGAGESGVRLLKHDHIALP
jgi:hypothetical protein